MNIVTRFFREGVDFIRQIYLNRHLIMELTRRDFRSNYIRNWLGLSWAILEPMFMMTILYFVFTFVRIRQGGEFPFAIYLLTGMIAFDFFTKSLTQATKSIKNYDFLVKKVNFRVAIIPMVKIISELFLHLIIMGIVIVILILSGVYPSWYWFQLIYYIVALYLMLVGLSWFTSSVQLFFPDISGIINLVTRVLFFLTPIFWTTEMFPGKYMIFVQINPLYYIVTGYRDSFLYHVPFWEKPELTLYFWGFTGLSLLVGIIVFKKLRPHFADVI
jgi:lipopolysaccharide transport system permease protein/teichoic acid transport system permease protein